MLAISKRPGGLLVPNRDGRPRAAFQRKDLLAAFRACCLEYRSTHVWRHSVQTMLHRQGIPYAKVERFVGHKLAGAGDTYTHLGAEDLRDVVAAIPGPTCEGAGAQRTPSAGINGAVPPHLPQRARPGYPMG